MPDDPSAVRTFSWPAFDDVDDHVDSAWPQAKQIRSSHRRNPMPDLSHYRKLVALVVAIAAGAVAQGLIVGAGAVWVTVVIGALAATGVYAAPNEPSAETPDRGNTVLIVLATVAICIAVAWALGIIPTDR